MNFSKFKILECFLDFNHRAIARRNYDFLSFNVAALPRQLLKENLFLELEIIHHVLKSSRKLEASLRLKKYDLIATIVASKKISNAKLIFCFNFLV